MRSTEGRVLEDAELVELMAKDDTELWFARELALAVGIEDTSAKHMKHGRGKHKLSLYASHPHTSWLQLKRATCKNIIAIWVRLHGMMGGDHTSSKIIIQPVAALDSEFHSPSICKKSRECQFHIQAENIIQPT